MPAPSPYFNAVVDREVVIVRFNRSDVVDGSYIERLGDDLDAHLLSRKEPRVVIDLGQVDQLSSTALGMMVKLNVSLTRADGGLRLANVSKDLRKIFKLTNLHKVLSIHDSVDKAVDDLL
ncbi:MAG: STAS domain-containing protein [Phycisphaerales bacterium]